MHKYTKAIIKACEKTFSNISRDLTEIIHLHSSNNIVKFLNSAQFRFEKTLFTEISTDVNQITIYQVDGTCKELNGIQLNNNTNNKAIVIGIDNMINFSRGIDTIAFSIHIFNDEEFLTTVCMPAYNTTIYYEKYDTTVYLLKHDGLTRKIKINQFININLPFTICAIDHNQLHIDKYFMKKKNLRFVSTGSLLCDLFRVLENKVDIVCCTLPCNEILNIINQLIIAAGGADYIHDNTYIFGKKSIVKSIIQNIESNIASY